MSQEIFGFDRQNLPPYRNKLHTALVEIVNRGNVNCTGDVTLTASTTTTTVKNSRISKTQFIMFMPTSANAAKEYAGGTMYVSSQSNGQFTITHTNCSETDRTFRYVFFG